MGIERTGSQFWSGYRDVVIEDTIAYCAAVNGLQILNVRNPHQVAEISRYQIDFGGLKLVKSGPLIYLLSGGNARMVFDVSDPAQPQYITSFHPAAPSSVLMTYAAGHLIIAALERLFEYDLSDPEHPVVRSAIRLPSRPWNLIVRDSTAYVSLGTSGMMIAPFGPGGFTDSVNIQFSYPVYDFGITDSVPYAGGSYGYIAAGSAGIIVVDPDAQSTLDSIGRFTFSAGIQSLEVFDDVVVADGNYAGLMFLALYNPTHPSWRGTLTQFQQFNKLARSNGNTLWLLDNNSMALVDYSQLFAPYVASYAIETFTTADIALGTQDLYVAAEADGLLRLRQASDGSWDTLSSFDLGADVVSLTTRGDTVFAALRADGFAVVDWTEAQFPVERARVAVNDAATKLVVAGSRLYVADEDYGVLIFGINNPFAPVYLGQKRTNHRVFGLWADEQSFIIGRLGAPASYYDATLAFKPEETSVFNQATFAVSFAFHKNYLYVGDHSNGLLVYNLSNPTSPVLDTSYRPPTLIETMIVSGHYLFIDDGGSGLSLWDITHPARPVMTDDINSPGTPRRLLKRGEKLYSADRSLLASFATTPPYVPGDVDLTETVDLLDAVELIGYLFQMGPFPERPNAADIDANSSITFLDLVRLIDYLFRNGPAPLPGTID